ncbi:transcriptional regulator [Streptococcus suis]|nr:transcriptional regulator [Streptococcus suis]
MRLFKDIDKFFTKKQADEVLSLYRRYVRIAGIEYLPKVTATYSFEPRTNNGPNRATEDIVSRRVSAQDEMEAIMVAVNAIIDPYVRQVIIERYCAWHEKSDKNIYLTLGYSESEFYRLLDKGLIQFAEAYRGGELLVYRKFLGEIC